MAKRKKRATARKTRSTARGKARTGKSARGKATRRASASRTPKKRPVKAGPKGAGAKKRVRKRTPRVKPPGVPTAETVIIDVIEEPVPGVISVTEFEATEFREASPESEQRDKS